MSQRSSRIDAVLLGLTLAVLAVVLVQCVLVSSADENWDIDPRSVGPGNVSTALGPAQVAWLATASVALAGAVLVVHLLGGGTLCRTSAALVAAGAAACAVHMPAHVENLRRGGAWIAAAALGLAAMHLAQHQRPRRWIIAALVAMLVPFAVSSVWYVAVDHPQTVKHFDEHEQQFLRAHGWQPGSAQYRLYKRRLQLSDATGVFGLSNVYGSIVAALTLAAAGGAIGLARAKAGRRVLLPVAAAVLGVATLAMTRSRGAAATFVLVLLLLLAGAWRLAGRAAAGRWLAALGMALIPLAVAAVIVRGALGAPPAGSGDPSLSILFRWYYWQGAARVITEDPVRRTVLGAGPAGFADAYLRAKNPLDPEEVISAHNVFVDQVAMLGLGGLAWAAVLLLWTWRAARGAGESIAGQRDPPVLGMPGVPGARAEPGGADVAAALALAAVVFGTQLIWQFPQMLPESLLAWLAGVAGFLVVAALWVTPGWSSPQWERVGLFAAALALVVHNQIEMTWFNGAAAPVAWLIVGAAAGSWRRQTQPVNAKQATAPARAPGVWPWAPVAVGVVMAAATVAMAVGYAAPMTRQQSALADAAAKLRLRNLPATMQQLEAASAALATDPVPYEWRAGLYLEWAEAFSQSPRRDKTSEPIGRALATLDQAAAAGLDDVPLLRLRARTQQLAARLLNEPQRIEDALAVWRRIADRNPYSLSDHLALGDLLWQAARTNEARQVYRRCLQISDQLYLDSDRQLSDDDRRRVQRRLGGDG